MESNTESESQQTIQSSSVKQDAMPPAENSYSEHILNVESFVEPMQPEKKESFEENKIQIMREDVRHGAIAFENLNEPERKETVI